MTQYIATCSDMADIITFGSGDPTSLAAFSERPFYMNTTSSSLWVQYGSSFAQVDLS